MASGADYYERDDVRDQYLAFHFPDGDPLAPFLGDRAPPPEDRYPACVRGLWDPAPERRALDIGCATGAMTFLLARDHRAAVGLDRSPRLVAAGRRVAREGRARYRLPIEGDAAREVDVPVDAPANASLVVGDALALPFADATFATVLALNLVDRVPDPARALAEAARVTAPGGVLIVASPYTWLEEYAPRARWLAPGAEGVRAALGARFVLETERDAIFFIRHHARSGQLGRSHVQRFRRNPR